jgi:hypothetical protein
MTTVFVYFRSSYDRGYDDLETAELLFDMIDDFVKSPAYGTLATMNKLMDWCRRWAGDKADALFETLVSLDEAMRYKRDAIGRLSPIYAGVSARYMTRPLVAMPDRLTREEESYFLPFVFNIHENEGRMDYIDLHGGRMMLKPVESGKGTDPRHHAVDSFRQLIDKVCKGLEDLDGAPAADYFAKVATSLRIYASLMRSGNSFFSMQILRDRNADVLSGPERIPAKEGTMTGDPDLLLMFEFMRDELDNTTELLELLENGGGMAQLCVAAEGEDEDTFLLGADVPDQLRKKMSIMRDHWLDATKDLAMPHK